MTTARFLGIAGVFCAVAAIAQGPTDPPVFKVSIVDDRSDPPSYLLPIDPTPGARLEVGGTLAYALTIDKTKMLSTISPTARPRFRIDDVNILNPSAVPTSAPQQEGKPTAGHWVSHWITPKKIAFTQDWEIVAGTPGPSATTRRLDVLQVTYTIENQDATPHKVGGNIPIDVACVQNKGPLFVASNRPDKILDGVELKGTDVPPILKVLERPDVNDPGFIGYFTLKPGGDMIGPDRVACTAHEDLKMAGWDVNVRKSTGDTDCILLWDSREIKPGEKITLAYAYGGSPAAWDDSIGRFYLTLSGSFQPGKLFSVMAYVNNPPSNQSLSLDLPEGMRLIEGKNIEPVMLPMPGTSLSAVLWKCRVERLGEFAIRVHSSNGDVQTKLVSISGE